jgi:hypothetical protein
VTNNFEGFYGENQNETEFNSGFLGFKNDSENKIKILFDMVSTNVETTIESFKKNLDLINENL